MVSLVAPPTLSSPYLLRGPNAPVALFNGGLSLSDVATTVRGPGSLTLQWLPEPRIAFSTSAVGVQIDKPVEVRIRGQIGRAAGRITRLSVGSAPRVTGLEGFLSSPLLRGESSALASVVFHVPNFPQYFGAFTRDPNGDLHRSRIEVQAAGWTIALDLRSNAIDALNGSGGYGITHIGRLAADNASDFNTTEVEHFFDILADALSFAAGARTQPILPVGFDRNRKPVWRSYAVANVTSWARRLSWFNRYDPQSFGTVVKGFAERWSDPHQREVARRLVYLYTEANRHGIEPALIIAQAALQLIAWQVLVIESRSLSRAGFNGLEAADKLRLLLASSHVPFDVPPRLTALAAHMKSVSALDAPQALTLIRNRWVHPPRAGSVLASSGAELGDAWLLSLWYLELAILKWLGYIGSYSSRVESATVEPVPWMETA